MIPEFLIKIDWKLLREQKQTLLDVISCEEGAPGINHLNGIVGLIDAIQDYAVDKMGIPENEVFKFEKE